MGLWSDDRGSHQFVREEPSGILDSIEVRAYLSEYPKHDFWVHRVDLIRDVDQVHTETVWLWGATDLRQENKPGATKPPYAPAVFTKLDEKWVRTDGGEK